MILTNEMLARYVGGQLEIQDHDEGIVYRGRIKTIAAFGDRIIMKLAWAAKSELNAAFKWVNYGKLDYIIDLIFYSATNIGPSGGEIGGDDRIYFTSPSPSWTRKIIVLFPPNGSKLDSNKVEGLPKAFQRLLALYPGLALDRDTATRVLIEKNWSQVAKKLADLPLAATLWDLLAQFRNDSSKEEFLWYYIEGVMHEKNVHEKVY